MYNKMEVFQHRANRRKSIHLRGAARHSHKLQSLRQGYTIHKTKVVVFSCSFATTCQMDAEVIITSRDC